MSARFDSVFRTDLFAGQVHLVTGGGTGIGRCIAHEIASLGGQVVIAARKPEPLAAVVAEITDAGGSASSKILNIRDEEQVDTVVSEIVAEHGRLDGLVNNAGGQFPSAAEAITPNGWRSVIDTNLNGPFHMCSAAFRHWMGEHGGAIVNIVADVWGGFPGMAHTGAARAGVINLTKTLGFEWVRHGVRVNSVAPGVVLSSGMLNYPPEVLELVRTGARNGPPSRLCTESEVSAAVVFLLSPAAAYITAETLKVDGAASIHKDHLTPIGHHDKLGSWNGFHLSPEIPDALEGSSEAAPD
ncbi:MAG TPA: SDR family NAD(P)-dependent oxidoreductase [Acidimicrobiales bacterium]|nr:SDR family NAD(P)-dependent oxidoreductase [Acidimicrobiales bacterium]